MLPSLIAESPSALLLWPRADLAVAPLHASCDAAGRLGVIVDVLLSGTATFWDLVLPADRLLAARVFAEQLEAQPGHFTLPEVRLCVGGQAQAVLIAGRVTGAGQLSLSVTPLSSHGRRHRALERDRERLQLVLEGTRLGMWDWNPQTDAVTFDERWAEMLGHSLDEIEPSLGGWAERVHPDDLDACFADIQRHIRGEVDFYENVHRMRHADGGWRYILDRGRIVERDAAGRPIRFMGTHTDITAQKEAALRARQAAQAQSHLLATMSHKIRAPLHGILGLLSVLDDHPGSAESCAEHLRLMRACGDALLGIVGDILDLQDRGAQPTAEAVRADGGL